VAANLAAAATRKVGRCYKGWHAELCLFSKRGAKKQQVFVLFWRKINMGGWHHQLRVLPSFVRTHRKGALRVAAATHKKVGHRYKGNTHVHEIQVVCCII
jgi:hypothetical protein